MSSRIKAQAAEALAAWMTSNLDPSVQVSVGTDAADWEDQLTFPSVRIVPRVFSFEPWQERELDDTQPDVLLLEVGDFHGTLEVRAFAASSQDRGRVEDAVEDLFLAREGQPGIIVAPVASQIVVGGRPYAYVPSVSYSLESGEWRNEIAFAKERWSFVDVDCWFPAMSSRQSLNVTDLIVAFNQDLSGKPVEEILVAADGSYTRTNL